MKICVDTTLQESVEDDFRGRVFSVYDTLFNVTFVAALLVGAFLLPASGISYPLLAAVGAGYLVSRPRLLPVHPPARSSRSQVRHAATAAHERPAR